MMRTYAIGMIGVAALAVLSPAIARADPTADCNTNAGADGVLGTEDDAPGTTECGTGARASGAFGSALGNNAGAVGPNSVAVGNGAAATGPAAITIGGINPNSSRPAAAAGTVSIAIGAGAQTSSAALAATAIGSGAQASDVGAVAIGGRTQATGFESTAVGSENVASGAQAQAFGYQALASGAGAIALGSGARATAAQSVALGAGATATRTNQVAVGTATSTYTLSGLASSASNAAQAGALRLVTTDLAGNLGTSAIDLSVLEGLDGRVSTLESGVAGLSSAVRRQERQANGGVAAAMALGGTTIPPGMRFAASFNLATYRGEQGYSGALVARVSDHVWVSGGFAGSTVRGSTGGRGGLTLGW